VHCSQTDGVADHILSLVSFTLAYVRAHTLKNLHTHHTSHTHSPRDALKRAQAALKEKSGLTIKTGVELEFHLLSAEDTSKMADGHDTAPKPCYNVEPLMRQV